MIFHILDPQNLWPLAQLVLRKCNDRLFVPQLSDAISQIRQIVWKDIQVRMSDLCHVCAQQWQLRLY